MWPVLMQPKHRSFSALNMTVSSLSWRCAGGNHLSRIILFLYVAMPFLVGDKVQNTKFEIFFLVIFGATLSRRFARQIFTSFLSRKDLTKLKKQKNGFLFFVLVTTRYDRARQSQQKLQFCTFFCTPTRNALRSIHMVDVLPIDRLT